VLNLKIYLDTDLRIIIGPSKKLCRMLKLVARRSKLIAALFIMLEFPR